MVSFTHSFQLPIFHLLLSNCLTFLLLVLQINYHKLSHVKQHKFIILPSCRSGAQDSLTSYHGVSRPELLLFFFFFLEALGKNMFSCLFQLLKATFISWPLYSIFKASNIVYFWPFFRSHISLLLTLPEMVFYF